MARAQATHDTTAADVLFEQGQAALGRGEVAVACEKFEESRKLDPGTGTLLNVGSCREKLGDRRSAWLAYREALRSMTASDDRRGFAVERVAALEAMLARVTMRWSGTAPAPAQSLVLLQGEAISPPYDAPRVVEPGPITVMVRVPGHRDATIVRAARSGEIADVVLATGEREVVSSASTEGGRALGTWPLVVGIGGGLLVATGGVFGVSALGLSASARDRCDESLRCSDEALPLAKEDATSAERHATVSTIMLASGAVALATAIVLQLTTGGERTGKTRLAAQAPAPAPSKWARGWSW